MQDSKVWKRCTHECLPNCEEVTYSYSMSSIDIEAKKMCQDEDTRNVMQCFPLIKIHVYFVLWTL